MAAKSLAETLTLIAEKAPALRAAGVRVIDVDDVHVELAPADPPEANADAKSDEDEDDLDPLDDPRTFGRKKTVPKRRSTEDD